jgi:hypothetical protein
VNLVAVDRDARSLAGLYLVVGGLASVAFSRRLVVVMVATVLSLEIANAFFHPGTPVTDVMRVAMLFLLAVAGFYYMERAERERRERAEDRLLRLDAGLKQLTGPEEDGEEETVSPLSEEGRRAQRAEHLQKLESHLRPLLVLAKTGAQATGAALLQVSADESSFWVRLSARPVDEIESRRFPLRGSVLAEVLRGDREVATPLPPRRPGLPGSRRRRRYGRSWPSPSASGTSRPGFWWRTTSPPSTSTPIAGSSCGRRRST